MNKLILTIATLALSTSAMAQKKGAAPDKDWHIQKQSKKVNGISLNEAYELLKGKTSTTIVVAVIDGGTDIQHEDLKDILWHNAGEIPFNGIDDDNNGYVDDTVGWNFIGHKNGNVVQQDNLEKTRLLRKLNAKFAGNLNAEDIDNPEYALWQELKAEITEELARYNGALSQYQTILDNLDAMRAETGKENPTGDELIAKTKGTNYEKMGASIGKSMNESKKTYKEFIKNFEGAKEYYEKQVNYYLNVNFDPRIDNVGDDYANSSERFYGNNNVEGPDADHGTHVSGIIGAKRGNDLGIEGVADNVRIMTIRVVPDGDERDKDVANGIRYAADNGAKIINMSFGKSYNWDKAIVDEAVKYAESKGVLLIHAAGNDSKNIDEKCNYPNDSMGNNTFASNWVNIGASQLSKKNLATDFSNYGQFNVDVFAPGFQIYSTVPNDKYEPFNGTSMASPVAAGVAALIWSYFPELTYVQVKDILLNSGKQYKNRVPTPTEEKKSKKIKFTKLSQTGRVVNAYNAVLMAKQITGK